MSAHTHKLRMYLCHIFIYLLYKPNHLTVLLSAYSCSNITKTRATPEDTMWEEQVDEQASKQSNPVDNEYLTVGNL